MRPGVDRVAIAVEGGHDLTVGEWAARSAAVAGGLVARGVGAGDRVGLLFDARHWADFAVAHGGMAQAGATAVLLSPGHPQVERVRELVRARAAGLLRAPPLGPTPGPWWEADVHEVEQGQDFGPVAPPAGGTAEGWLVHAWAPCTPAGCVALELVGSGHSAASLATFDADRFCALVDRHRAVMCGLTPALAAAVVATGAAARHDLSTVTRLILSAPPSAGLWTALGAAFAGAELTHLALGAPGAAAPVAAPVAVSQEGMLWHERFTPGSFNLPCLVRRYRGPLDLTALGAALAELVRRHEPLRSSFVIAGGRPGQIVGPAGDVSLAVVDLSGLPLGEQDEAAARMLADATSRPFDLATAPLFEPRVVRLGADDHLLMVRLHHTVFDDWSVDVLRRELSALYASALDRAPSPLTEPPTTFSDFCRRQRDRLAGERGEAQLDWWRRELAGGPLAVQLPIGDGSAPGAGEPLRFDLPASLAAAVRAVAPRLRATPFMTVLAAFSVLLSRRTGQDDLVIATVVAHRDDTDVEPLIGCFTKKVPLRLRLGGDPTFAELVARTRTSLLGSLSHQEVAFDAAVQAGLGEAAAAHGVVPQVAVVFQAEAPQRVRLAMPGLVIGPYDVKAEARRERHFSAGTGGPDWGDGIYLGTFLILSLMDTPDAFALVARGVFSRPAARNLLEDFQRLLTEVVADPDRPLSALADGPRPEAVPDDALDLRGFRASRSHIEAALARCPGVADVGVAVRGDADAARVVAYVVADDGAAPTLTDLRHALWTALPGAVWPAEAVVVTSLTRRPDGRVDLDAIPPGGPARAGVDPRAETLAAMWEEISGRRVGPHHSYWQDFSFLQVLTEAREAGLLPDDEQALRCRTPAMLAASPPA